MSRWTDDIPLERPLAELVKRVGGSFIERLTGRDGAERVPEFELASAEERLGRPIPPDLRRLLGASSPDDWDRAHGKSENGVRLFGPDELFWIRPSEDRDKHTWARFVSGTAWADCHFLAFGGDNGFRYMCVCVDPPPDREGTPRRPGTIVWADYEWDDPVRVMASTLAQWLDRYIACGMFEPAVYPGNEIRARLQTQLDYFEHYVHLNPHDEWGKERRARLLLARNPPKVDEVHIFDKPSGTMRPISQCVELEEIHLAKDQARSLKPLRPLFKLRKLRLEIGEDRDLGPLASLQGLEDLSIQGVGLDLRPLKGLSKLNWVCLDKSGVRSLEPLASCPLLRLLQINQLQCDDWTSISTLHQVQRIHADSVQIRTVEPFSMLSSLIQLALDGSPIVSIEPLRALGTLTDLGVSKTRVTSIEPLGDLGHLEKLGIGHTSVENIAALQKMDRFRCLVASRTRISSIAPLQSAPMLEKVEVNSTGIDDLGPLEGKSHLSSLEIDWTGVRDLSPLASCSSLQWLSLDGCPVKSISPLLALTGIEFVSCRETHVPAHELQLLRERFPAAAIYGDDE